MKKALEDNKKAGAKYLADNGKKKGVKKTKSGLQYEILKNAKGEKPQGESVVQLHYKAYLTDGTVFDDTYERNTPSYLTMFNLIDGLQEGLKLMNEGSKYKIVIPSDLAYGDDDVQAIPGGSTVIFEVELLKVYKPGELADDAKDKLTPQELMQMHGGMPSGH